MNVKYITDFLVEHGPSGSMQVTDETEVFCIVDGEATEFTMEIAPVGGRVYIVADGD